MNDHSADREENGLDEVEKEVIAKRNRIIELQHENTLLRKLLWLRHDPSHYGILYGDDREMQCAACMLDFKRNSAEEIEETFIRLARAQAACIVAALDPK